MSQTIRIACLVVSALGFCAVVAMGMGGARTADGAAAEVSPGATAAPDLSPYVSMLPLCIDRTEPGESATGRIVLIVCR